MSCSKNDPQKEYVERLFSGQIETVFIELDYMQGVMPEVIDSNSSLHLWQLLEYNLDQIFLTSKNLLVPLTASDMNEIPAQNKNYTRQDLISLAIQYRDSEALSNSQASIYVLWLDGYFQNEQGNIETQVLGLSIAGQSMVVVFKPAVSLASSSFPQFEGYAEQVVVSHEVGHVIGLVNNGVPNLTDHLDANENHGTAHCTNTSCVMFWQNESKSHEVAAHVSANNNLNFLLFGAACLNDAHSF